MTGDELGLDFGGVDFWKDRPVSELIAEAGAKPVESPADLELHGVPDDAWAAPLGRSSLRCARLRI